MNDAHRRKKNPEQVRHDLVASAALLALQHGLPALSLEMVASAAGVTKGGLFHHFPNKQALIDALFDYLLELFEAEIDARMQADPEPFGRFTRAYVDAGFSVDAPPGDWSALWLSVLTDPALSRKWGDWFAAQLHRYGDNEAGLALETARFAADGVWNGVIANVTPADAARLRDYLLAMTRKPMP